jgi:hypothetical protein
LRLFFRLTGPSVGAECHDVLTKLNALFGAVVTGLAKALQIVGVVEQRLATLMRDDVIRDRRNHDVLVLKAELAQWLGG